MFFANNLNFFVKSILKCWMVATCDLPMLEFVLSLPGLDPFVNDSRHFSAGSGLFRP
jgi:hypothetical protein